MKYIISFIDEEGRKKDMFSYKDGEYAKAKEKMRLIREELNKLDCVLDRDLIPCETIIRFTRDHKGECKYVMSAKMI